MIYEKQRPQLNQRVPEVPTHGNEASSSLLATPNNDESGHIGAWRLCLGEFEMDGM